MLYCIPCTKIMVRLLPELANIKLFTGKEQIRMLPFP